MPKNPELRIGLTPAFKRIAYYYLCLGIGEYYPQNHPHYNRIVVREFYEFSENPCVTDEYAGGVIVEFYLNNEKIKWIEFRCQVVGGGGRLLLQSI